MSLGSLTGRVLLFALPAAVSACAGPAGDCDGSVGEQLIRDWVNVWNSKDLGQIDILYAEDGVYEDIPGGDSYHGAEAIGASWSEDVTCAPDIKVEIVSVFACGTRGVLEWVWSGTQMGDIPGLIRATGRPFSVRGVTIFEFEDGRIKRNSDYYDAARFLHQLGVQFQFPDE